MKQKHSKNPIIIDLEIYTRITGGQLPSGLLADLGRKHNVSRERVRQLANKAGLITLTTIRKSKATCMYCERKYVQNRTTQVYCSRECREAVRLLKYWEIGVCEQCKLGHLRYKSGTNSNQHYCSKKCMGRWLGKNNAKHKQ